MKKYRVVVNLVEVDESGNLQFLPQLEPDAWQSDYVGTDANGNEVYEIEVAGNVTTWVERQFDTNPGVVDYSPMAVFGLGG